jgi:hypothetical protein
VRLPKCELGVRWRLILPPFSAKFGFDCVLGSCSKVALEGPLKKAEWWYCSCGTDSDRIGPPSMMELSGEAFSELPWQSDVSLMPETELALVVADDSVEAGC